MPGVPSGRGCDACRKQKKKCDQLKPTCSRCARLWITCIGSGEQRYKFKDQNLLMKTRSGILPSVQVAIPFVTNNEVTVLSKAFIHAMEVKDPRFDMSFYIPFCALIPQRLGNDKTLDAAVSAIVVAHTSICAGRPSVEVYVEYGKALKALRFSLDDPTKTASIEILTAIYLVMIFQEWIDVENTSIGLYTHTGILVHILNAATCQRWSGDFEVELLHTIAFPVLVASIFNPGISLDPWFLRLPTMVGDPVSHEHGRTVDNDKEGSTCNEVGVIPSLEPYNLRRLSVAMKDPQTHFSEILALYSLIQLDCKTTRDRIDEANALMLSLAHDHSPLLSPDDLSIEDLIRYYQVAHGFVHGLALFLNSVLRMFDPLNETLTMENDEFCDEMVRFGQQMVSYKPLGSSYIPPMLCVVIALTENENKRLEAEDLLIQYSTDHRDVRWKHAATWLKAAFQNMHRTIMQPSLSNNEDIPVFENNTSDPKTFRTPHSDTCAMQ